MRFAVQLSILIPVYNWDIGTLLRSLHEQCLRLSNEVGVEILVRDDGSTERYCNESLAAELQLVRYEESVVNQGRAATRNALIQQAKGDYVLFLDADMLPDRVDFLQTYLEEARQGCDIVCGGISYQQSRSDNPEYSFYLYKSLKTEAVPATVRNGTPWRYLFTSNVMVRRDIAASVPFDPRFIGYGFEDIEWGFRLSKECAVLHIDNTCTHMGMMNKQQVFARMRDSIPNYTLLLTLHPTTAPKSGAARLSRYFKAFPDSLLMWGDKLLSFLFSRLSWNPLLLYIFQCDKSVLLARALKMGRAGRID